MSDNIEHRGTDPDAPDVEVNQIVRIQSENALDANVVATGQSTTFLTDDPHVGQIRAGKDLAGNVVALNGDIFAVRVLDPGTPASGEAITGDILAENGHIGTIFSTRPIGDGSTQPKIYAADGIEQIRIIDESVPGTTLDRNIKADIQANRDYVVNPSHREPADNAAIFRIETAGDLSGTVKAGNVTYKTELGRSGIFVRGELSAPVTIDCNLEKADIIAGTISSVISVGVHLEGSIVATDSDGEVHEVWVGYGTSSQAEEYENEYPRAFSGIGAYPIRADTATPNNVLDAADWFGAPVYDGGSRDSVIRAAHIGKVEIARMTTFIRLNQSHKDYVPRIESPDIESLSIGSLRSGIVWSGNLTFDSNGDVTAGSFDEPYATIGELHVGCWWSNGDIWMEGCPTTTIDNDLRGRLHVSMLALGETVRVGRELSTAYGDSLSYCPCDVDDSADPCVSETGYNTSLSEPSPRRGRLRGTESLASNTVYGEIMTRHNDGLEGQVILNRNDVLPITGFTGWEGLVTLGEFDDEQDRIALSPNSSSPDESPYYEHRSVDADPPTGDELGGGAVGLVPFHMHDEDCTPPNGQVGSGQGIPAGDFFQYGAIPVLVRHYGPIKHHPRYGSWSAAVVIEPRDSSGVWGTTNLVSLFQVEGPGDSGWTEPRGFGLSKAATAQPKGGVFRIRPVAEDAILCADVDESNGPVPVVWDTLSSDDEPSFEFRVLPDCDLDGIPDSQDSDLVLCPVNPCAANYSNDNTVSVQDIFDFLAAYFSANPCADFNNSGTVSVQDIFDFLAAWFAADSGTLCDPTQPPNC